MAQLTCPVVVGRERELEDGDTLLESALAGKGALFNGTNPLVRPFNE